jgi:diguanylate cyclase (GGDEF)-like protein
VGDAVLRAVGQGLSEAVRPMDVVARFGGEEFAVVLPNCPPALAGAVAERVRQRVQDLRVPYQDLAPLQVTVSCGGAFALGWQSTRSEDWIARADEQLYHAKHGGRNRVCLEAWHDPGVSAEEKGLLFGSLSGGPGMMTAEAGT